MKLKVLSWNIWGGKHIEEVLNFLSSANADIVALQEVIPEEKNGNTALTIARRLGYEAVYAVEMPISSNWTGPVREKEEMIKFGNAILSKHKIIFSENHELSKPKRRVALSADIKINNTILHVFSIHLKHAHVRENDPGVLELQKQQTDNLIKKLPSDRTIVMGDFNALPKDYPVKKMKRVLQDTEKDSHTPTWSVYPEGCDVCSLERVEYKLDYIFASKDLKTETFQVGDSRGSDHLPISVILEV